MDEKQPSRWFQKATTPARPDLLDPAVSPREIYRDDQLTGASPEMGGEVIDLRERPQSR